MPNVVLRYGSFNPQRKRAEALARAGELGATAVRVLTSEGVLEKEKEKKKRKKREGF